MNTITRISSALLATLLLYGCGSSKVGDGDGTGGNTEQAFLTIVGDRNVFLENGWTERLTVRYHDANDQPLAGQIDFRIEGVAGGAELVGAGGITNADGIVAVDLVAGEQGQALFTVVATAAEAEPVTFEIAVSQGPDPLPPLDPTGRYALTSQFDVVSGLPGTAGDVVNGFIDMTDDPYDPATYVLDLISEEVDSGFIEDLLDAARPALDGIVNDLILSYSPEFITKMLDIGDKLGQITRQFGLISTLDVAAMDGIEGGELLSVHTVTGIHFDIDSVNYTFAMQDFDLDYIVVENVPFRMENDQKVYIDQHSLELSYGSVIWVTLNELIVPLVDPSAVNLEDLMNGLVDCTAVGIEVADYLGFGSPGLYEGACEIGISAAVSEIENQIRSIDDAALVFTLNGDARPQDTDTDRKVDVLLGGQWEGEISYAGTPAPLSRPDNTFRGERMAVP